MEAEVLIRGEEAHELVEDLNTDAANLTDVEVSPGTGGVGSEVISESVILAVLADAEDFSGGNASWGFSESEFAVRGAITVLSLASVGVDHWSHEKFITIIQRSAIAGSFRRKIINKKIKIWFERTFAETQETQSLAQTDEDSDDFEDEDAKSDADDAEDEFTEGK